MTRFLSLRRVAPSVKEDAASRVRECLVRVAAANLRLGILSFISQLMMGTAFLLAVLVPPLIGWRRGLRFMGTEGDPGHDFLVLLAP
jgi:hypothetical protein